ncbi:hypothetical protein SEHO0A_00313 [Salmonella enterica subsp. houtenae str. ATCC BAA-1581]|nr:hypothetical protein SEHO0A_00313 [Salmonella enterica subsp. houtenae str. ATCC BAA-1581]
MACITVIKANGWENQPLMIGGISFTTVADRNVHRDYNAVVFELT